MAVRIFGRQEEIQLSDNFNTREFKCKGKTCGCTTMKVSTLLVRKLQVLRNKTGRIRINSGYRCPIHNKEVGGEKNSYHMQGTEADIVVSGYTPKQIAKMAQEIGFTGIGMYDGPSGHFVHVGVRARTNYWVNTNGHNVSVLTHGGIKIKVPYALSDSTLHPGARGDSVRAVQFIVNWCGYPCKVDGSFGSKTETAVKNFQHVMLLKSDGIVGPKTIEALRDVVR